MGGGGGGGGGGGIAVESCTNLIVFHFHVGIPGN